MNLENTAISNLLKRAVELDGKKRYTESLICYQEGMQLLLNHAKELTDNEKKRLIMLKLQEYMTRAETIKNLVEEEKKTSKYHEEIEIAQNDIGHSYDAVFGRFLVDGDVEVISIEDPYIRQPHQLHNLSRFCELAVKKAKRLKTIKLLTVKDGQTSDQDTCFCQVKNSLASRNVDFQFNFSQTLHDRTISFSNGWIFKLGRGLDYFKAVPKYAIGFYDLDLRPCNETNIDIYHKHNLNL